MEKAESQKEKEHIINDGYRYRKDRVNADGSASWRCCKRDCKGRIKVMTDDTSNVISEHNHAPDPERSEEDRSRDPSKSNDHHRETKANNSAKLSRTFIADSEYVAMVYGFTESDRTTEKEKRSSIHQHHFSK